MAADSQQAPEGLVSNARIESLENSISSIQDTLRSMAAANKEALGSPSPGTSSTPDQPAGQAAVPVSPSFVRAHTSNQPASPANCLIPSVAGSFVPQTSQPTWLESIA
eukprot:gene15480-17060_t